MVLEELELEIGIRQRLADVAQRRLQWALMLKSALEDEETHTGISATEFKSAALDALASIEEPLKLLRHESVVVPEPSPQQAGVSDSPSLYTNEPSRARRGVRSNRVTRNTAEKLLFVRLNPSDNAEGSATIAKLACIDCGRSDFPKMQGLLNHCRIRHSRSYGSHDECIQECAVSVNDDTEREWILQHGTEVPAGNAVSLPSLRRIFEQAVGTSDENPFSASTKTNTASGLPKKGENEASASSDTPAHQDRSLPHTSTQLSRTLGHHKETPTLAPFLGRTSKRRDITLHHEELDIDIGEFTSSTTDGTRQRLWSMRYHGRSKARSELDEDPIEGLEMVPPVNDSLPAHPSSTEGTGKTSEGTRFHILARISISDRSQWIPPDHRPAEYPEHTHQWMISVDSPSYSRHVTTFLSSMTVTSLTDSVPPLLSSPVIVSEPPFILRGTSSAPFLANLKLNLAPTLLGNDPPSLDVQHWVDLDPFKHANPALGDEQMLDVELDRTTVFLPLRENRIPLRWGADRGDISGENSGLRSQDESIPAWEERLKSLLPKFPMTVKDAKTRHPPKLQYRLVLNTASLLKLPTGRRKSIEMARARALADEYHRGLPSREGLIPLTPIDVFRWLEDENQFVRPESIPEIVLPAPTVLASVAPASEQGFCLWCGLSLNAHTKGVKPEAGVSGPPVCPQRPNGSAIAARLPLFDVYSLTDTSAAPALFPGALALRASRTGWVLDKKNAALFHPRVLVAATDPGLTVSIRKLTSALLTPTIRTRNNSGDASDATFPLSAFGESLGEVASTLAPYALMGLLLKPLVRRVFQSALPHVHAVPLPGTSGPLVSKPRRKIKPAVLSPYHILYGLRQSACENTTSAMLLLLLARLGADADEVPGRVHVPAGEGWEKVEEA